MRLENIPVVLGAGVLILGAAILWDAAGPQTTGPMRDRRRREREGVDLRGELTAGLGICLLGVAMIAGAWRFETLTILAGSACLVVGALRNRKYFRETFLFRGATRRDTDISEKKEPKMRIR